MTVILDAIVPVVIPPGRSRVQPHSAARGQENEYLPPRVPGASRLPWFVGAGVGRARYGPNGQYLRPLHDRV